MGFPRQSTSLPTVTVLAVGTAPQRMLTAGLSLHKCRIGGGHSSRLMLMALLCIRLQPNWWGPV